MRYQVTFQQSAVVTLNKTVEVEAEGDADAISKALAGDYEGVVGYELGEIHSAEDEPRGQATAVRVG